MRNPWLAIPLADYEGHMALPDIAQAQMLSGILADVAEKLRPRSLAVLGCAGGNGFDRISPAITGRVVGVDLNPLYIAQARARHEKRFRSLELLVADIQKDAIAFEPVDLVFAALVLEYVDVDAVIARTRAMLGEEGALVTVVQLPGPLSAKVTPSPFASLQSLAGVMRLVPPDEVRQAALSQGYIEIESGIVTSAGGKQFQVQVFNATG
jgi:SAM-dependent methyltransferase